MAAPFDYTKLSEIVARLIEFRRQMLRETGSLPPLSDPVEEKAARELRSFGQKLNGAGGHAAMEAAAETIEENLGPDAANILNYAWDGIGDWFA